MAVVTATPAAGCAGDCNGDRRVTINELITGVTIALGSDAAACPDIDANADQAVTIDELVRAVSAALNGCAAA